MTITSLSKSWDEVASRAGQETYDFVDQLSTAAKHYTCNLWSRFPNVMLGPVGLGSKFTRGYMNQACRDIVTLPEITPPLFTGGQCPIKYNIRISTGVYPSSTNCNRSPDLISNFSTNRWGPIGSIVLVGQTGQCGGYRTLSITSHGTTGQPRLDNPITEDLSTFNYGRFFNIESINITPIDNIPDNCGDVDGGYPPDPEVTPNDLVNTYIFNNYDGTMVNIPVGLFVFNNDINGSLELPITLDVGGIKVQVDLSGFTFDRRTINNYNQTDGERLDNEEKHPLPNPEPEPTDVDPPIETELVDITRQTTNSGFYELEGNLQYVRIIITELPINTSSRHGGVAPDVQYTGWFEWITNDNKHPRTLIQFDKTIWYPPIGATHYAYTLYKGALGYSIETYLVER